MQMKKKYFFCLLVFALICFFMGGNGNVFSQATLVTLEGVINDQEGIALPGATITVRNMETGYENSSTSRSDGDFVVSGIQPGRYEVEVKLPGFSTQIRRGMTFAVGAKLKIDFTLVPSSLEEEVTVTAEAPIVEVTKSEISSVVDRQKIDDLPLLDRDFADLTIIKAGVIGGRTNAMPDGMGELLIDGMSNEHIAQAGIRLFLPADAIQEFRVITNQFAAEFGNASGIVRSAITQSGTNQFKGRLAYFYRDEVLDTPNYFVNHDKYNGPELEEWEKSPYKYHNVSGYAGGPIKKDKAHFFLAYEGLFQETYTIITSPLVAKETVNQPRTTNQLMAKFNYQPSEKHLLAFRFSLNRPEEENSGVGGRFTRERAYDLVRKTYEFQLNWTLFPSNSSMNEIRVSYGKDNNITEPIPEFADSYSINRPSGFFGKMQYLPRHGFGDKYQFADNFSLFLRGHTVKAGFDYIYRRSGTSLFSQFIPGMYIFFTDAPFDPNNPATYPVRFQYNAGEPAFTLIIHQAAVFIQDSWRLHPQFTLNYGIRYNWFKYTGLDLDNGIKNLNPRVAFSWDPIGDGRTAIRGGIGTFTANVMSNIAFPKEFNKDMDLRIIMFPGYPDPFQPNPFRPGFEREIPIPVYDVTKAPSPYSLQTTLGAQRELFKDFSLALDLIWTKGYDLVMWNNLNPVIVGTTSIHQDPIKGDIWVITNAGKSDYKAIYLNVNKRYSNGWALEVSYTLGKQMGNTEGQDTPWTYEEDCWDRAWGRKSTDARHKLAVTGIVDIPFGFQLSGIVYYRSAYPWNAVYAGDPNRDGLGGDYVDQNRNSREGFDEFFINTRASKYINISRFRLQFFAEIYNLTNRTNFRNVHNVFETPGFGEPLAAGSPRLIQLGFRFNW